MAVAAIFQVEESQRKVEKLWAQTFEYSNRVIVQVSRLGFEGIEKLKTPTLAEMMQTLQMVGAVIDALIGGADYDEQRLLLNARKQITNMELLASAWQAQNQKDFDEAVQALKQQAPF